MSVCFKQRASRLATVTLLFAVAVIGGCGGSELDRSPVQGTVTFKGQSVINGDIRFVPIGSTSGPVCAGNIMKGEYSLDTNGGVPAGKYRVEIRILGQTKNPATQTGGGLISEAVSSIGPPIYDSPQSPLTIEIPSLNDEELNFQIP